MKTNLIEALIKFEGEATVEIMEQVFGTQMGKHLSTKLFGSLNQGVMTNLYRELDAKNIELLVKYLETNYMKEKVDYTHCVSIQTETFKAVSLPTTQEDNAGGIVDRFDLYQEGNFKGHLVQWHKEGYGLFMNGVRLTFPEKNVINRVIISEVVE